MIAPETIALLGLAAGTAGVIDSIAGGGGLITVPALLAAGLPPVNALATNKLQSVFSQIMSTWRYARRGLIEFRSYGLMAAGIFVASAIGAFTVQHISADALKRLIPFLVIGAMLYMLLSPRMTDAETEPRLSKAGYSPVAGAIGFYDGFFGPGAGSFLVFLFVRWMGYDFLNASASAKVINTLTNAAALLLLGLKGHVWWHYGLVMAVANVAGSLLGTRLALRHGAGFVRGVFIAVVGALILKTGWDAFLR